MRQEQDALSREEFYAGLGGLSKGMDAGFSQVNARLDKLNGKTETHGQDIAVLKDRARRDPGSRKKDGAIGGAIAAAVLAIVEGARYWFTK